MSLKQFLLVFLLLGMKIRHSNSWKHGYGNFQNDFAGSNREEYKTWQEFTRKITGSISNIETDERGSPIIDALKRLLHNFFENLLSSGFPTAVVNSSLISQQCVEDSISYVHSVFKLTPWALQMKESSGNLPIGMFGSGNLHADGLFDECLSIRPPASPFTGEYCTVFFKAARVDESEIQPVRDQTGSRSINLVTLLQLLGLSSNEVLSQPKVSEANAISYAFPSISFCLPASCNATDLGTAVAELVGRHVIADNYSIVTVTDERYCFKADEDPPSYDAADITVITLLSILGFLVVMATVYEVVLVFRQKDVYGGKAKMGQALLCFSFPRNCKKILSMRVSKSPDSLPYIHGMRALSICWVLIGHTWLKGAASYSVNPKMLNEDGLTWWFQGIANATISVDTFLVLSGLLVSFLLLRELDKKEGRVNIGLLYLHRYLRLTIVYGVVLGFIATLLVYVGTGPNWPNVLYASHGCRINWWEHLFYINNLFPTDIEIQCMAQTWYLALDMQLFILTPLIVYILWRWQKAGLCSLAALLVGTLAANFAIIAVFDLPPTLMLTRTRDNIQMGTDQDYIYTKPWTRAPPYIIGVFLGWILYQRRRSNSNMRLPKIAVTVLWLVAAAVGLSVIYGLVPYVDEAKVPEIDPVVSIMYGSLHRTAWAAVVAWIIFACDVGYGGFINRILSWKGFIPLSRLSYCVYLVHYEYLTVFYAANRKLLYYTFLSELTTYFGIAVTVFGLALLVSATIEAPFLNLEKLIYLPKRNLEEDEGHVNYEKKFVDSLLTSVYRKPAQQ